MLTIIFMLNLQPDLSGNPFLLVNSGSILLIKLIQNFF